MEYQGTLGLSHSDRLTIASGERKGYQHHDFTLFESEAIFLR